MANCLFLLSKNAPSRRVPTTLQAHLVQIYFHKVLKVEKSKKRMCKDFFMVEFLMN
jgi:hypothetical protein